MVINEEKIQKWLGNFLDLPGRIVDKDRFGGVFIFYESGETVHFNANEWNIITSMSDKLMETMSV